MTKREPLQKLWRCIVRELTRMCADPRPEVRTAAMHSLTSALTSHGASLSGSSWDFILLRLLMPLMREVAARASSADASEPVAPTLGKEGGRPVLMLLHHTRDTASKQWDDTWVLALRSFSRLFRTFLPLFEEQPSFELAWEQLLSFCERSLLSLPRSSEVGGEASTHPPPTTSSQAGSPHEHPHAGFNLHSNQPQAHISPHPPPKHTHHTSAVDIRQQPTILPPSLAFLPPCPSSLPPPHPSSPPLRSKVAFAAVGSVIDLMASSVAPRGIALHPTSPLPSSAVGSPQPSGEGTVGGGGASGGPLARLPPALWRSVWGMLEHTVGVTIETAEARETHKDMLTKLVRTAAPIRRANEANAASLPSLVMRSLPLTS